MAFLKSFLEFYEIQNTGFYDFDVSKKHSVQKYETRYGLDQRCCRGGLGQRGGLNHREGLFLEHQNHQRGIFGQNFFLKNAIKSEF